MDPVMDVDDDWELLPDQGFLEMSDDGGGNQIYCRSPCSAAAVVQSNYFICPPRRFLQINIEPSSMEEGGVVDQDPISQVFFKTKMKEAEFVDNIKADAIKPARLEPNLQFDDKSEFEEESEKVEGVWRWSLSGIGAICSLGVAAAIIVFTSNHNHKLHFRIYTDDKVTRQFKRRRMKVKGAIAAVSGVREKRARITVGGYYDDAAAPATPV